MKPALVICPRVPESPEPNKAYLPVFGSNSLNVQDLNDFRAKLRSFLDRLENMKFLQSIEVSVPEASTEAERSFLHALVPIAKEVSREIQYAVGSYEDSLLGVKNFFENIPFILQSADLGELSVKKPFCAVIISAGPSLDLEIENLKKIYSRVLFCAVDAVLPRLVAEGLDPDIVVSTERGEFGAPFFENIKTKSLLVAQATVPFSIISKHEGPKASISKYSGPFLWLPFKTAEFWSGGSSSHVAYRVAAYLGAKSIALVGQDLCFHPESFQSHARLNVYDDWSADSEKEKRISEGATKERGNLYDEVLCRPIWNTFSHEYSVICSELKLPTVNTSKLGRRIDGVEFQELEKWIHDQASSEKLEFEFPARSQNFVERKAAYFEKASSAKKALGDLRQSCASILSSGNEALVADFYKRLPYQAHFLELCLELVVADFMRTEILCFQNPEKSSDAHAAFIKKSIQAIDDVLSFLNSSL